MAVSGSTLITDALWKSGALGKGDYLDADTSDLALRDLNRMLDSWSNERSMLYTVTIESFAMTAGVSFYNSTYFTGADRPVAIDSIYVTSDGVDFPLLRVDNLTFQAIPSKASTGLPDVYYYDAAMPDGLIRVYPTPDEAYTLNVVTRRVLSTPITLTTQVDLPAGYEKAIVDNLALECCATHKLEPTQLMLKAAMDSRAVLKRINSPKLLMTPNFSLGRGRGDIFNG
jgi:hypothetical protein